MNAAAFCCTFKPKPSQTYFCRERIRSIVYLLLNSRSETMRTYIKWYIEYIYACVQPDINVCIDLCLQTRRLKNCPYTVSNRSPGSGAIKVRRSHFWYQSHYSSLYSFTESEIEIKSEIASEPDLMSPSKWWRWIIKSVFSDILLLKLVEIILDWTVLRFFSCKRFIRKSALIEINKSWYQILV